MKENETDYLNKLFASSSDVTGEVEVAFPLVEAPEGLSQNLYAIADSAPVVSGPLEQASTTGRVVTLSWPRVTSIAASFFVAVLGFQFYQQQQTLRQLEQAQADLAMALHYLGEANRIARSQVLDSLNDNIKKAGVEPAMEIGRDALRGSVTPNFKQTEPETRTQHRSL